MCKGTQPLSTKTGFTRGLLSHSPHHQTEVLMAEVQHKAHAEWSASATSRNWNCPGALALTKQVAHLDKESEAAAWGTACHEVSEQCLWSGQDAEEWIDRVVKTKEHSFEVDEEMAECAQTYIDYVRDRIAPVKYDDGFKLLIEQRFSLESMKPPFEAGGTADTVMYFPDEKLLEVVDLKGGRGVVVEVVDNKQLRTYALGAMLANPGLKVERIMSTIVQPRAPHKDGRIRSETFHVMDLIEWMMDLRSAMNRAKEASDAYAAITGDITREEWAAKYLSAGNHCTFCPAAGFCPALEKKAFDAAGVWFDDGGTPQLSNTPADLSPEKLATVLEAADMIEQYLNACRRLAHTLAEGGTEIPGFMLVDRIGRRRWAVEEADLTKKLADEAGLTEDELYVPKLRSPAQLEKVLGKKRQDVLKPFIETPVTGTTLVSKTKTTKPPATPKVNQFFNAID